MSPQRTEPSVNPLSKDSIVRIRQARLPLFGEPPDLHSLGRADLCVQGTGRLEFIEMRYLRAVISGLLFLDLIAALSFWAPARVVGLKMLGRTGGCQVASTLRQIGEFKTENELRAYLARNRRVVDRGPGGIELWDTPRGRLWSPANDRNIPYILAEQEMNVYTTGTLGAHKGDIVLDCGANIGLYTKTALANGAALVVAIEPAPDTVECLRRNLAAEIAQGRVIVYPKGVWDHEDILKMSVDKTDAGSNSFILQQQGPSISLPVTTIDNIVRELKLPKVDFIKMDIEGSEKWALRGARETLLRYKPQMAISAEHLPDDSVRIPEVVKSLDPRYHSEASDCLDFGSSVRPQVFFFYQ